MKANIKIKKISLIAAQLVFSCIVHSSALVIYNDLDKSVFVRVMCDPPVFGKKCHCSDVDAYYKIAAGASTSFEGSKFYGIRWMDFTQNKEYEVKTKDAFQQSVEVGGGGHIVILPNGAEYTYDKGMRVEAGERKESTNKNALGNAQVVGEIY